MGMLSVAITGLLYLSLGLSVFFFAYCLRRRETRGARSLAVMFTGVIFWILADLIQLHTPDNPEPFLGLVVRFLGPDIAVIGVLLFALEYTGRERFLTRRLFAVLSLKPLLTLLLVVSPYRDVIAAVSGETVAIGYAFSTTPLLVGHVLYSYALMVSGIGLLLHMMVRANYGYQRQIVAVLAALVIPFGLNASYHAGVMGLDLTSSSFLMTAVLFVYTTFKLRLMDAIPVARQAVVEEMDDLVLVLDEQGTIITVNEAVRETFGTDQSYAGLSVDALFENGSEPFGSDRDSIAVTVNGETRFLDVNKSPLRDYRGTLIAEVLVCRDVTEIRERERELRQREQDLQLLKDLQSRFLRHNLRNELNVIRANAEMTLDEDDPEQAALQELIIEKTDRILDWSTKARTIEHLLGEQDRIRCDVDTELETIVDELADEHEEVAFEVDLAADREALVIPQIEHAFENVIDNAARYNTADSPRVSITTRATAETVELTIQDNGPGIDEVELEAIRTQTEQPLTHASGLGLWLVYWVVEKSDGTLSFESGEDGTTVTMRFDSAPASADEISSESEFETKVD